MNSWPLCAEDGIDPETVLRGFMADLAEIISWSDRPRTDGYNSNGSDERSMARAITSEWAIRGGTNRASLRDTATAKRKATATLDASQGNKARSFVACRRASPSIGKQHAKASRYGVNRCAIEHNAAFCKVAAFTALVPRSFGATTAARPAGSQNGRYVLRPSTAAHPGLCSRMVCPGFRAGDAHGKA